MDKFVTKLRENWPILTFIGAVVAWYFNTNERLNNIEAKAQEQQTAIEEIAEMKTDIAVIKANVTFIKERLD